MSLSPKEAAAIKHIVRLAEGSAFTLKTIVRRAEQLLEQASAAKQTKSPERKKTKKSTGTNATARRKGQRIRRTGEALETLRKDVKAARAKGMPVAKIAAAYNVSAPRIYSILKD